MKQKVELRYVAAPLISIIAFIILIGGASYAYYSQSVGGATSASNIANANLTVPRGCSFLANATNCSITSSTATTTSFTDSVVTRAEMSQAYSGNSVAQSTCALNIGVQGQAGCKCTYTVSLVGQTTTNYISDSLRATINKDGSALPLLPSEYQQVEYITFSGAQQISTGYTLNPETDGFQVTFKASTINQNGMMLGSTGGAYMWSYYYQSGDRIAAYSNSTGGQVTTSVVPRDTKKHVMTYNSKKVYFDSNQIGDWTSKSFNAGSTMYIGSYGGAYYFQGNIYGVSFYRNGVIQKDFVPCYRKSDIVIGMYDLISNTCYPNSGCGSFTKGANVSEFEVYHAYSKTGTITVASTGTAVYNNFSVSLKGYNSEINQDFQAGLSYVYYLRATPTCTVA